MEAWSFALMRRWKPQICFSSRKVWQNEQETTICNSVKKEPVKPPKFNLLDTVQ